MKNIHRVLTAAALIVAAGGLVWAGDTPTPPNVRPGQAYERAATWRNVDSQVTPMPIAITPPSPDSQLGSVTGPVAKGENRVTMQGASAIPAMGGGAIFSPMQRTDLEIKKLIRRLG